MITRRAALAMPLLIAASVRAQPADPLVAALIACWQARGVRFTPEQVAARIGGRTGRAALLALAGSATDADGEGQEIAVEIVWEAGAARSPAEPLLIRDLADGLPAVLLARDDQWWLLRARYQDMILFVRHPLTGTHRFLPPENAVLIGRPVIAGA
ncbi:MAG: hypothetical protein MUE77_09495 [Sandarakinorhabdus sp.]|jgi:hypothetical protein|nr:hypothetical protein [Sandarakinorhabdus sp.]